MLSTTPAPRPERATQARVTRLFTDPHREGWLGYHHLGDLTRRNTNTPVEEGLLRANLRRRGYPDATITRALATFQRALEVRDDTLAQANQRVYGLLRYGVKVQMGPGQPNQSIALVAWDDTEANDFALAEEVTLRDNNERRIDLVVYLNGIAVAAIELKRASVDIGDAVRQLITNQEPRFNQGFFTTVQLLVAGSDTQGIRYGTTGTPEQFYTAWKPHPPIAEAELAREGVRLDRPLAELFDRDRLLDLLHHFVVFDGAVKKVPRPHQYLGIKAAQRRIHQGEGGVIWHTQGSGKSILMVLLAKWTLETYPDARILVITDREELDKQITGVMQDAGVVPKSKPSPRVTSRRELANLLSAPEPRLMCALLHKFDTDTEAPAPEIRGRFFVFVDECHRTQGGDMNRQMREWLPGAVFIGFTGTPLLRKDKKTTRDTFGDYIHTYKFDEAMRDGVVLDLKYHARAVDQRVTQVREIDDWFERKTRALNGYQRSVLRKRYASLEQLSSSQERKQRIIADIIADFGTKQRLNNDRGTAILVASSIYDACHYYRLFQNTGFGDYCAVITSYEPVAGMVSKASAGDTERYKYETYERFVLRDYPTARAYETAKKEAFIKDPTNTKLLIVVSKLLTGFDAPSCTYIYLDHTLRDHNLFQAICRTNRLDGDDKPYGHIVDYRELFRNVEESIAVYTSDELDLEGEGADSNIKLKDWREEGRRRLDDAREQLSYLCEPIPPPRTQEQHLHYFAGHIEDEEALDDTEASRISLYKLVASLVRAYASLSGELSEAGYGIEEIAAIETEIEFYKDVREALKLYAGEVLDVRPFEADMRHLIDTYILADPARASGQLADFSLLQLIVETGINDAIARELNAKRQLSKRSIAEAIVNNVRKAIIRERLTDPRFYAEMSVLLKDLVTQRRLITEDYEQFLRLAEELVRKVQAGGSHSSVPEALRDTPRALVVYRNLASLPTDGQLVLPEGAEGLAELTLKLDRALQAEAPAGWKDEPDGPKARLVQNALHKILDRDRAATMALFELLRNQASY